MKKIDREKENQFVEYFVESGNATQSAIKIGYPKKNAKSMGYYLRKKLALEIDEFQKEFIRGLSSKSIGVLESLLNAESENVRLNACKLVLDCNGYTNDTNVNVKVNHSDLDSKTDEELIAEFDSLIGRRPKVKAH